MLHVCSLARLSETVDRTGATHLVSLINADTHVPRPDRIAAERHLFLGFNDIITPVDGLVPPAENHVAEFIRFVRDWDRRGPMVIHCWAGISRSTAGAYIAACALNPGADEAGLAEELRRRAPSATPNARLVAFADKILGRNGRMIDGVRGIGRGADAFEGTPFEMPVG
ncbi:tyrosine phosphatase family protein [Pannonibacter sp.]|uniref:tyrosine phosphatase family protein n=1 Tax=Pannonibacter sp. TaxID=1906786 RepID=UPI003F71C220